jgi:hypothetical protein
MDDAKIVFEKIQAYGYFNDFKRTFTAGQMSVIYDPRFNPALITNYKNILLFLKVILGSWTHIFFKNEELKTKTIFTLLSAKNNVLYTVKDIENFLLPKLDEQMGTV